VTPQTVVIACDTFAPDHNGSATFAKNLACELQTRGYEVHVIAPAFSKLYGTFREKHDGIPIVVHRLKSYALPFHPTQRFVNPAGLTRKLDGLISAISPQVVHIQSHLNVGHHAAAAAKSNKIRLVATNHLNAESFVENVLLAPSFIKKFLAKMLMRDAANVFRSADSVVAPTLRSAQLLESVIPNLPVYAISGGVELSRFNSLPTPSQEAKTITYVGRLDREKHVYVLLEALAKLPGDLKLELIGSGNQQSELAALAKQLRVSDRVTFFDDLNDDEVILRLGKASVFVMPSIQELQSMATLEAMAAGRVIVAAEAMALPYLVESGVNGYLFRPDSPNNLAEKIQKVFNLPKSQFDEMGRASRERAAQHDLADTVTSYERLYAGESPLPSDIHTERGYTAPAGVGERIGDLVRKSTSTLEKGANGVLERLDGVRGSVAETFGDVRFLITRRGKRVTRKLSASLRKALERIRRDD
jgi:glycosyltransferase involved in cell wall biosynthesis